MLHSPGTVTASDPAPQETVTPATETPDAKTPVQPAPFDAKALLDVINADREQRDKRSREDEEAKTYKAKYTEAQSRLDELDKAKKNRLLDPAGFLKKMGYTDRELALTSEGIMYSLMPDKAPPGHIANLVRAQREQDEEDRIAREKAQETAAQTRATESATAQERELETHYRSALKSEVTGLKPGTYPASQAWFADDHDGYAQELFATARNVAIEAGKTGAKVDLSPAGIAPLLEKRYADRAKRLSGLFQPLATQPPKPIEATSKQEEKREAPVSRAESESERTKAIIERAAAAAFGRR